MRPFSSVSGVTLTPAPGSGLGEPAQRCHPRLTGPLLGERSDAKRGGLHSSVSLSSRRLFNPYVALSCILYPI